MKIIILLFLIVIPVLVVVAVIVPVARGIGKESAADDETDPHIRWPEYHND
jgi:flagellar basal body-associated protein FliL